MTKINLLLLFFLTMFLAIIGKLFYWQILKSNDLKKIDYLQVKKIQPKRGEIYDRFYQPLVLNENSYLLYVEPKKIKNKEEFIKKIDSLTKLGKATIEGKINNDKYWVALKSGIDEETKIKLINLKLRGIGFEEEMRRFYPEGSLAAHLLGFVGKNEKGENIGYFGIEGYWEKDLAGFPGILKSERDILGMPIFVGIQEKIEEEDGRNLVLTIDKSIQMMVKEKLKSGLKRYDAKEGCIVVADPNTLEIIALSCLPDFDPNNYFKFSEDYFKNPIISNLYEPGSIFKPLVLAAAINEKKVRPSDIYNEVGPINIDNLQIKTWDNKYEGKITITRIIEKSSNVGMVYIGEKLGKKKLLMYLNKYGIGEITGIDLQGEISGFLKEEREWYPIDYATATFGQGVAVTPIQMITAFASIINGGKLLRPFVVKEIIKNEDKKIVGELKVRREIINYQTSEIMKRILESAVENGEIHWVKPKGYRIGGKTGTAQVAIKGHYDPSKTIASFIGFAPIDKPKFIILVSLREPKTSPWGSETAAPLFFEIAKEMFIYYNIAPES